MLTSENQGDYRDFVHVNSYKYIVEIVKNNAHHSSFVYRQAQASMDLIQSYIKKLKRKLLKFFRKCENEEIISINSETGKIQAIDRNFDPIKELENIKYNGPNWRIMIKAKKLLEKFNNFDYYIEKVIQNAVNTIAIVSEQRKFWNDRKE